MRHTTNTLAAVVILLASISHTQAGDMTDEQMLKRAVEVIAKEDASAKVTPVQSKNLHLGTWALMNPLPEYRLFCARLNPGKEIAAPNRSRMPAVLADVCTLLALGVCLRTPYCRAQCRQ